MLFTSQIFSLCVRRVQPFWVGIEKIIPYLRYPKFRQWENLIIQLQTRSQGSLLPYLDSTCLNDNIVIKIKKIFSGLQQDVFPIFKLLNSNEADYDNQKSYDWKSSILRFPGMTTKKMAACREQSTYIIISYIMW